MPSSLNALTQHIEVVEYAWMFLEEGYHVFHGQQLLAFIKVFFFGFMYGVPPFSAMILQFIRER